MRLYELLLEGREADLYHGTSLYAAEKILTTNTLGGVDNSNLYFSRNLKVAEVFATRNGEEAGVIFVINQPLLYRDIGKKLRPHSEHGTTISKKPKSELQKFDQNYRYETEEYVIQTTIPNFSKYIKKIWIMGILDTPENNKKYSHVFNDSRSQIFHSKNAPSGPEERLAKKRAQTQTI